MNIQLLNKIAKVGLDQLGDACVVGEDVKNPDGIMVRSAVMHEMEFNPELKAIARAGAGVNNIPIDRCSEAGIVVFNTPGANANGVKELAICALLLAARNVVGGIEWASSLKGQGDAVEKAVEKGKKAFVGPELRGKTLGVVGLGYVGLPLAIEFAHKVSVVGFDINETRIGIMKKGSDPCGELDDAVFTDADIEFTSSVEKLKEANFYVIAVPTPIDNHNKPDLKPLLSATKTVASVLKKGDALNTISVTVE